MVHEAITGTVIGCAMRVHRALGCGFPELVYARSLTIEMTSAGLDFQKETEWPIYYRDIIVGRKRVDFLVEGRICVELKAIYTLTDKELVQGLNYLESHGLDTGLLINFGSPSLQFKRLFNKKHRPHPSNPAHPNPTHPNSTNPINPDNRINSGNLSVPIDPNNPNSPNNSGPS